MSKKKAIKKSKKELDILSKLEKLQERKRKLSRQADDIDTEMIGLREELLKTKEKTKLS